MTEAAPQAQWRAALAEGRFLLQRARGSGTIFFPPRLAEPRSGDSDWEWIEASGFGTVHAVTVIHPRPPEPPRAVVLVDLDEEVRLMSEVEGVPAEEIAIGLRVRARIGERDGAPILLFEAA
ncbi:Zn-ribbon domain-containing OB-fold protein [Rhizorhabdus sp. FW153]|uniref:Zn-ribbon domain-containing OB-fold protein n=1 Tax=Rhizorhabdus sp. FW153 TaxID=3400216 RepID=UPI003CE93AB9